MTIGIKPVYAWALIVVAVSAVLALAVSVQAGFFTVLFAVLAWWAYLNPPAALIFLVLISPLLPLFKATQVISLITLSKDIVIGVLCLRLCIQPLLTKQLPYRRQIIWLPLLVLWLWVGVAAWRADSLTLGILRARDLLLYSLLYLAVVYMPLTKRYLQEVAGWLIFSFVVTSLLAGYQWFWAGDSSVLRFDPVRAIWIPRISSTFGHPSVYGEYLIVMAVWFSSLWLITKNQSRRILAIVLGLLTLPLIYLTYSRAAWLGLVAAIAIVGLGYVWPRLLAKGMTHVSRTWFICSGILVLLFIWIIIQFTSIGTFIKTAFDPQYESNRIRLDFVARLIAPMSNMDALVGRGLGDVTQQIFRTNDVDTFDITSGDSRTVQLAKDATLVDNQYLKTFVEMGLVGLLIYAWLVWRFLGGAWRLAQANNQLGRIVGLTAIGFIISFIVQAFFIDIWDIFPTNLIFWLLAGLVSALSTPNILDEHQQKPI